jgi:hypothetical protein
MELKNMSLQRKRKKNFIIDTKGQIINSCHRKYVVQAYNEEEAKRIAKSQFMMDYSANSDSLQINVEKKSNILLCFAFIMLCFSVFLSYRTWVSGHSSYIIAPSLKTIVYSLIFYMAFFVRAKGIHIFKSPKDVLFCILIIFAWASILEILLAKKTLHLLGIIPFSISTENLLIFSLVFSLFGIKIVSCLCYIIIAFFALTNLSIIGTAMGSLWGPIYMICTYIGIMIYIANDYELHGIVSIVNYSSNKIADGLKNDFFYGEQQAGKINSYIRDKRK